jgi:hypothetical protein
MRLNDAGGLIIPSDVFEDENGKPGTVQMYDFKIMTSTGQRAIDARTAAKDYDRAIARVAMMQFLHLGDRAGGSYGLSEDQSGTAMRAMRALVGKYTGEWNRKVLPLLWEMNGMDKRYLPGLNSTPIAEDSLGAIGDFIDKLAGAQEFLDGEPDLKRNLIGRIGPGETK